MPTIVAIHGFRGDHHGLEPIVERLAGYRLIVPDLPGFGDSAPFLDRKHDVAGYADWLIGFVSLVRGQGPLVLLGHSFGSIIVSAAIARGLDADRVVLINPIGTSVLHGPRALLTRLAVSYYRIAAAAPERIGQALLASRPIVRGMSMVMAKTHDQSMRRWIHDQHRRYFSAYANRQVVVEAFAASTTHDVSEYAGQIPIPILLIIAERDDITRVDDQYRLAHQLTSAEVVLLRRVGHLIHYEAPAAAAAAIIAFLERGDHL